MPFSGISLSHLVLKDALLHVSVAWINPKEFQGWFWAEEEEGGGQRKACSEAGHAARDFLPIGQL